MKKAGSTTLILQVLSAAFLVVLIMLAVEISRQFLSLQDGAGENAVWTVYQLDRDVRAVGAAAEELRHQPAANDFADRLSQNLDAVRAQIELLREPQFRRFVSEDAEAAQLLSEIDAAIAPLAQDRMKGQQFDTLAATLAALPLISEKLLAHTNTQLRNERATARETIVRLERTSAVMLGLLMVSVVFLVVTLRRQLKSVRKTGLELETMARQLTEALEGADAGNRAKSQFMATMGHEIRTPLNAILGMSELLELSQLPPDAMSSVKTIRSSGEALLEIINEILDYSKIEHGKMELEERIVDVASLAETTVSIIRGRADDHENTVVLDIPESLDALYVRTDPTRLRQVLLNLLSNAVKFTKSGTVTLRLREFYRHGKLMLRFEVEDTGIGIDEAGLSKLFKPFSQVDASISRKYGGTGLGLTICKQIVEKLGGELGMSSTVGVGSIFWFELAVVAVGKDEMRRLSAAKSQKSGELPRLRILLVEDNRVNQQVATRFLNHLGQDVTVANDGAEAVAVASAQSFDVILMDMQMPVMDGIEATRRIISERGPCATVPIIAMTANASDDDRRRCLDAGMAGFESKPVTMERLRNVISSLNETLVTEFVEAAADDDDGLPDPVLLGAVDLPGLPQLCPAGLDEARYAELVDALGEDVFQELVESFFDDASALIGELHGALRSRDVNHIDRVLHTIKGAAVNVGLTEIAGKANALREQQPTTVDVEMLNNEIETMKFKLVA
ncbi:MAG: hybrid sensor histidine kinase/response regulator [Shinella sp.]|nr:MAG: hybrid sensor histidine kinase/response regulator [Shinella sp.]